MCAARFPVTFLVALAMIDCAMADPPASLLIRCEAGDAQAAVFCEAVRAQLQQQRPWPQAEAGVTELVVVTRMPRPNRMLARIDTVRRGRRHRGEQAELSVMDRATIPQRQRDQFVSALVNGAKLPFSQSDQLE